MFNTLFPLSRSYMYMKQSINDADIASPVQKYQQHLAVLLVTDVQPHDHAPKYAHTSHHSSLAAVEDLKNEQVRD